MTNKLRTVRNHTNCRLWELAARSGVSASTLSAIERYNYKPRLETKQKVAAALGVMVEEIWPKVNADSAIGGSVNTSEVQTP